MIKNPTNYIEHWLDEQRLPLSYLAYKLGMMPQTLRYKIRGRTDEELPYYFNVVEFAELADLIHKTT